jgi:transcriptional regulator of met regulon
MPFSERHPGIPEGRIVDEPRGDDTRIDDVAAFLKSAPFKDLYLITLERLQKQTDELALVAKARLLAEVYFGREAATQLEAIQDAYREVGDAARDLLRSFGDPNRSEQDAAGWEETIWDWKSGGDSLSRLVDSAVSALERICRPELSEPGRRGIRETVFHALDEWLHPKECQSPRGRPRGKGESDGP